MRKKIITIDFETYYDKDYSLSKLTTEEYVRDERFEIIGVGVKEYGKKAEWFTGPHIKIKKFLESFNLQQHRLIAHNAMFDGFILYHSFSIVPSNWCDTLSMGRAIHTIEVGGSLKELARYYNLGIKGDEVIYAVGKKRLDFTQTELDAYGEYCN